MAASDHQATAATGARMSYAVARESECKEEARECRRRTFSVLKHRRPNKHKEEERSLCERRPSGADRAQNF